MISLSHRGVVSSSSLGDSDSYSSSLKFSNRHYTRAQAPLIRNVRIPGLMFLLVLCGCRFRLATSQSDCRESRKGSDMLDTLIGDVLFSRDGREDGVMLDTLIGERSLSSVEPVDMLDTLGRC